MSDAAPDAEATDPPGREIWIEKYRPETLDDVHGHDDIVERLHSYIEQGELPHLLFAGPAGVGKCVTGETPVLTSRGVERMEAVVGDVNGFEEPASDLQVASYDGTGSFEYVSPSHVFGKTAEALIEIRTRDGNNTVVTPEHKLLTIDGDGFEWKRADDIRPEERLARPLSAPTIEEPGLDVLERLDATRTVASVSEQFAKRHGVGSEVDLDELRALDAPRSELRDEIQQLQYVNASGNRSEAITPPWEVTPDLARFVGLAVSEARIDGGRIKFYNTDEALLDTFEHLVRDVFGVRTVRGEQHDVPYVRVGSRTLTHFLESTFDVFACASGADPDAIGSSLVTAGEPARTAFLQAMFDAEGHVTEHGIVELTQRREEHITLLSYLLASVGVPSRRKSERKAATNGTGVEREYHTLYISGATALRRFRDSVGFSISQKQERLEANAAKRSNPNHDTMPTQAAVKVLCERLNLPVQEHLTRSLNPETPGRVAYCDDIEAVVTAASERMEAAQEVLERLETLHSALESTTRLPAAWTSARGELQLLEARRDLSDSTGIRSDRLLEYADGRRTPTASRAVDLLVELDVAEDQPNMAGVQAVLQKCVETLGVTYNEVADGTDLRGTEIIALLENDDHDVRSMTRFETVSDRLLSLANGMLSLDVLEHLHALNQLADADLYYDEVTAVEPIEGERKVYDLTVPETRNYVAGSVPTVMHNTTCATAIAREVYGDDWRGNFLELNASDERGIDVVRDRIKNFARSAFGSHDYRIIFLDEADSLTSDAQSALRRTMEQFSDNTRFILSCNYSNKIIDPIQSRCAVFRFSPLSDDAVEAQVRDIAEQEGIDATDEGVDALVYAANGDMRRAINNLQAAATTGQQVDAEAVYAITATARPEEIEEMANAAIAGDFAKARATLDTLLSDVGMAGGDVVDQLHRGAWEFDLPERDVVRLLERLGETDYRIAEGANEQVQLEALLASLALAAEQE